MALKLNVKKWVSAIFLLMVVFLFGIGKFVGFGVSQSEAAAFLAANQAQQRNESYRFGSREIHRVETGNRGGPMVLFLHGSPGDWTAWLDFLCEPSLLERARLVSVDRPGFGQSNRGWFEPSLARQAAALKPILEMNRSGNPAILVGHSFGGPLAIRLAMDYPDLVGGLVLVAPSIDPTLEKVHWYQIAANWRIFSWFVPRDLITANQEILPLKGELEKLLPGWPRIRVPVTVIQGGKDGLVPPENAAFAQSRLINSAPRILLEPQGDHFILWTQPDIVTGAIVHHLDLLSAEPEGEEN